MGGGAGLGWPMHPAILHGKIPRRKDIIDPQIAGARIGPIYGIQPRWAAMLQIGRGLPTHAGRLWVLQLGMGQKLAHHRIVPLTIKGIEIGIGQQHEGRGKLVYQPGGIGNFIGIAAAVTVLWAVKDWWAGVKCEEVNRLPVPSDRGLQHRHIG